jgi:two-component system nitrogen regulation response regulator GlnG
LVLRRELLQRFLVRQDLMRDPISPGTAGKTLREVADDAAREAERQLINETLRTTRGNKSQAARLLQTDYKTLHVKMKALGIRGRDFSDA